MTTETYLFIVKLVTFCVCAVATIQAKRKGDSLEEAKWFICLVVVGFS